MNKVVNIEELSLEELRKYHERKMLEMFNLVQSLLEKAGHKRDVGNPVLWIGPVEFVRLYTSIEELTEKIRLLEKENSSLKERRIVNNAILDSRAMQISEVVAEELTELRDKVIVLNDTLLLFEYEDIYAKKFDKVKEIASDYGLKMDDVSYLDLLKSWDKGGIFGVKECVKLMLNEINDDNSCNKV